MLTTQTRCSVPQKYNPHTFENGNMIPTKLWYCETSISKIKLRIQYLSVGGKFKLAMQELQSCIVPRSQLKITTFSIGNYQSFYGNQQYNSWNKVLIRKQTVSKRNMQAPEIINCACPLKWNPCTNFHRGFFPLPGSKPCKQFLYSRPYLWDICNSWRCQFNSGIF